MANDQSQKVEQLLHVDFNNDNSIWLTNSKTLRKTIGILGMALPLMLIVSLYLFSDYLGPLESLSHYYFTQSSALFVGTLSIIAIFLMIYKGKELIDLIVSVLAGISALCVAIIPTSNLIEFCQDPSKTYAVTYLNPNQARETVHYIAAALFLGSLAYMSMFLFTKSNKPKAAQGHLKRVRNFIYTACGITMILALLVIFIGGFLNMIPQEIYVKYKITFWMEVLAIECFGFSWLIKGETLFKD